MVKSLKGDLGGPLRARGVTGRTETTTATVGDKVDQEHLQDVSSGAKIETKLGEKITSRNSDGWRYGGSLDWPWRGKAKKMAKIWGL